MQKFRLTIDVHVADEQGGQDTLPVTFEVYGESARDAVQRFKEQLGRVATPEVPMNVPTSL